MVGVLAHDLPLPAAGQRLVVGLTVCGALSVADRGVGVADAHPALGRLGLPQRRDAVAEGGPDCILSENPAGWLLESIAARNTSEATGT